MGSAARTSSRLLATEFLDLRLPERWRVAAVIYWRSSKPNATRILSYSGQRGVGRSIYDLGLDCCWSFKATVLPCQTAPAGLSKFFPYQVAVFGLSRFTKDLLSIAVQVVFAIFMSLGCVRRRQLRLSLLAPQIWR